jgi:Flp pilus assembly protein protease CpaA
MTHADAVFMIALLFIIALEVGEMNLREQGFQWPWAGAFIGVVVSMLCFALAFKFL